MCHPFCHRGNVLRGNRLSWLYIQVSSESSEGSSYDHSKLIPRIRIEQAQKRFEAIYFIVRLLRLVVYIPSPPYLPRSQFYIWTAYCTPNSAIEDRLVANVFPFITLWWCGPHTHLSLAKGMNVSIQDSYNQVCKLGAVISGSVKRKDYRSERPKVTIRSPWPLLNRKATDDALSLSSAGDAKEPAQAPAFIPTLATHPPTPFPLLRKHHPSPSPKNSTQ